MTISDFFILIKNPDVGCIDRLFRFISYASEKNTNQPRVLESSTETLDIKKLSRYPHD